MFSDDIALINAYSVVITSISTIVLVLITIFYSLETRKMRIGAKAPMLSIQCDYAIGEVDIPRKLFLYNYGPVAQNITLNAEVWVNGTDITRKKFLYSMALGERTEIVDNFYEVKDKNGMIVVKMKYYDADMKIYRSEITVDFNEMTPDRVITVPEAPSTEMSGISTILQKMVDKK
jgi:hypothetical protein